MISKKSGRKTYFGSALVLGALLAAPVLTFAETNFAKIVPGDSLAAFWTNDVPALREGMANSPYGKLWADPACEQLRSFVDKKIEEKDATTQQAGDATMDEFLSLLTGGAAIYIEQDGDVLSEDNVAFTGILETNEEGRTLLQEKMKAIPERFTDAQKSTFETSGVTVYTVTGTPLDHATGGSSIYYAFTDDHFVYSEADSDSSVKTAIDRLKGGQQDNTFSTRSDLRKFAPNGELSPFQANGFVNTGTILKSLIEAPDNQLEPAVANALPSTGLYDFESMFFAINPSADNVDIQVTIATPSKLNGVMAALQGAGDTPLSKLKYAPADALSITSFTLDVGLLYDSIMAIAQKMRPEAAGQVNMILGMFQMQTGGVDIVSSVLKNFSGEHLVVQRPLDPEIASQMDPEVASLQNSTAIFFGLKNGEATVGSLKTLLENIKKNQQGLGGTTFDTEEVDGVTIVRPTIAALAAAPTKPAFAFNKDVLVFANNEVQLMDAVRALSGKATSSLADNGSLQKTSAAVKKEGLHAFAFTPKESVGRTMEQFRFLIDSGMLGNTADLDGLTSDMLPSAEVVQKYFGDSYSTIHFEDGAIRMQGLVNAPAK